VPPPVRAEGEPAGFGWICVFNDVIWWPVFWRFALDRRPSSSLSTNDVTHQKNRRRNER
jgi:hypothetical protein